MVVFSLNKNSRKFRVSIPTAHCTHGMESKINNSFGFIELSRVCVYSAYQRTHLQCTPVIAIIIKIKTVISCTQFNPSEIPLVGVRGTVRGEALGAGGKWAPRQGPGPWPQAPKGMRAGQMVCLQKGGHFHPVRREQRSFAAPSLFWAHSGGAAALFGPARGPLGVVTHLDRGNQNTVWRARERISGVRRTTPECKPIDTMSLRTPICWWLMMMIFAWIRPMQYLLRFFSRALSQ